MKHSIDLPTSEIERRIAESIHNQTHRDILRRRIIDGVKYEPLAEEFGLSVRWTKVICYRGIAKLNLNNA